MQLSDFIEWHKAHEWNCPLVVHALGLGGETGEALEHVKKHFRDGKPLEGNKAFALELGDVLFYWWKLVCASGFTPEQIMQFNIDKLTERRNANIPTG